MIQLQDTVIKPGEKRSWFLSAGQGPALPCTVICGNEPGRTLLVTAGIHGAEYPGIAALTELSAQLDPGAMSGNAVFVHIANPSGFFQRAAALVPEDKQNLNRMFPGKADGTFSQQIAWTLNPLQKQADFYLDLHSGDLHESLIPYVYYPANCPDDVSQKSRSVAQQLSASYLVKSQASTGAYNSAAALGTPSLLLERGGNGQWSRSEVEAYKDDVLQVMKLLSIIQSSPASAEAEHDSAGEKTVFRNAVYLSAAEQGLWYPAVQPGVTVAPGALLGEIRHVFGDTLETFHVEESGTVLYQLASLAVNQGDCVIAIGVEATNTY